MPRSWFTATWADAAMARLPKPFSPAPSQGGWQRPSARLAAVLAFVLLTGCSQTPAPSPISLGSLVGKARLEGVFTDQASIRLHLDGPGGTFAAATDVKGNFAFREIPAGSYQLTASRERYYPVTLFDVTVAPDATLSPITLRNHRELVRLSGIYDPNRLKEAEDPEFGGMVPVQSPFLTNLTLSPDGERLGFIQDGAIRSVRLDGTDLRVEKALPTGIQADWVDWGKRGFLLRSFAAPTSPKGAEAESSATFSLMLLTPEGAQALVPSGRDELFAPVFSPDETEVAFIRYVASNKSPQLMRVPAMGGPAVLLIDLLDRLHLRGIWDGTYGLMFSPLEWRQEGLMFHAPMTCSLERAGFTLGKDGIYVLRDPSRPDASDALHKAHFYSYYAHAFSHDGQRMIYAYGPQIRSKSLEDPVVTAPGINVGNHSDEVLESLIPSPDGERLFYLTPKGIEEMNLLPLTAAP